MQSEDSLRPVSTPAMTPQQRALTTGDGGFAAYRRMVCADTSLPFFVWFELVMTLFSGLPGIAGLGMRSVIYPSLFKRCGKRPAFGKQVVLRNPRLTMLGDKVLIDDYAVLDARGTGAGITVESFASIGRFTTLAAKGGSIQIGAGANIGSYCRVATQSRLEIGESVLVAAYCYIGPGNHQQGTEAVPLIEREMEIKGGVKIGAQAWIGAHSTILDGVTIGERAIVGAHSLVKESVPPGTIVAGIPAKIIGQI